MSKGEINAFLEFVWMMIRDRIEYFEEEKELKVFLQEKIDLKGVLKQNNLPEGPIQEYIQELTRGSKDFMSLLTKTQKYKSAMDQYNAYQSWKNNRNESRAELEAKCGYDSKHAAHCIRLLRMGNEILLTGEVKVLRPDYSELLNIRKGNVPYEEVISMADDLFKELNSSYVKSNLPHSCNIDSIDNLSLELIEEFIGVKF